MLYFSIRNALSALRMSVGLEVPLTFTAFHHGIGVVPEYYRSCIPWVLLNCTHTICFTAKVRHNRYIYSKPQEASFTEDPVY